MKKKMILLFYYLIFAISTHSLAYALDSDEEFIQKNPHFPQLISAIWTDPIHNPNSVNDICDASGKVLTMLRNYPNNRPPDILVTTAATAYGQFTYLSPTTCRFFDECLIPHLNSGRITYKDLRAFFWDFTFGKISSIRGQEPELTPMPNEQQLVLDYYLNYPLYFNRLFGEFTGKYLLIGGGGEDCGCGTPSRYPKESFYHVGRSNFCSSDLICNMDYREHLHAFPKEKFSFICVKYLPIREILINNEVLKQYFRMAQPGALFVSQNFLRGEEHTRAAKEKVPVIREILRNYKIILLDAREGEIEQNGEKKKYFQIIAQFPYKIDPSRPLKCEGPKVTDTFENYREPNNVEQRFGLAIAKCLSNQTSNMDDLSFDLEIAKLLSNQTVWSLRFPLEDFLKK